MPDHAKSCAINHCPVSDCDCGALPDVPMPATSPRKLEALPRPADPEVIAMLETLLVQARTGEIAGFVFAAADSGGVTTQGYVGLVWTARMLGSLEILKHRVIRDMAE